MQEACPYNNRKNINQYSGGISENPCDITEYDLPHEVIGADVEHVDLAVRMECKIERGCSQAAGEKQTGAFGESAEGMVGSPAQPCIDSDDDQKDMPGEGVNRKRAVAVVHSRCVEEGEDAAKQSEIHQKGKQDAAYFG